MRSNLQNLKETVDKLNEGLLRNSNGHWGQTPFSGDPTMDMRCKLSIIPRQEPTVATRSGRDQQVQAHRDLSEARANQKLEQAVPWVVGWGASIRWVAGPSLTKRALLELNPQTSEPPGIEEAVE